MMKVSLVIYEEAVLSAVAGVIDLLAGANNFFRQSGREPAFQLELVGEKVENIQLSVPAQLLCYTCFAGTTHTDLILVPAFTVDRVRVVEKNQAIVHWIKKMHEAGAEVASLCVGSYFLAEAGLLTGKEVTSHWAVITDMQQRYPLINMKPDRVITDQDGIYTSGGAFSSLKLVLYLIEKFCGWEAALWLSKMYAIDMDRSGQAHFAVFAGQHQHEDAEIMKTQLYIEKHYAEDISVDQVAAEACMGRRNFIRRFKSATKNTPLEYLQRVRVEAAKKAFEMNEHPISTIMYNTGYKDVKSFRMIFKRITGLSPQEYRKKYARGGAVPGRELQTAGAG
jgi:transcriptional regulator GlxA family with amidase domain